MAASVVYEGVPNTQGGTGTLFQGQKLWFSATVPQRQSFIEKVKANGGEVVQLEKQADILLVDHMRKNPAPGTHSYKYVDLSIRKGRLENLDDHIVSAASRANRPVGSVTMAPKGGRHPYTNADDQFLWNWVKPLEDIGAATAGNSIYQQLEAANPRHTYQSWRDRWLKYVRHQNRKITTQVHGEQYLQATPRRERVQLRSGSGVDASPVRSRTAAERRTAAQEERWPRQTSIEVVIPPRNGSPDRSSPFPALKSKGKANSKRNAEYEKSGKPKFADDEYKELFEAASYILNTQADRLSAAWRMLAEHKEGAAQEREEKARRKGKVATKIPIHLADEWRVYFESVVGPDYDEQLEEETGMRREDYLAEDQPVRESVTIETTPARSSRRSRSPDSHTNDNGRAPSPSFPPGSQILSSSWPESATTLFSSTTQDRVPGPNEARKRSASKGTNSQEPTSSAAQDANSIEELSQRSTQSQKRKRIVGTDYEDESSPPLPPLGSQEQAKRRKTFKEEPRSPEIPSTPEPAVAGRQDTLDKEQDWSREVGSPTPRPRRPTNQPNSRSDGSFSPLFVPQGPASAVRSWSQEPGEDRSSPPSKADTDEVLLSVPIWKKELNPDPQTSPLSVRLVSDPDPPASSSFSQLRSDNEQDDSTPTTGFETAPEFSQVWETAHEEGEAGRPDTRQFRDGTVGETPLEEDFALPEPAGGWDDLPLPRRVGEEEDPAGGGGGEEAQDEGSVSSGFEDIQDWVAAHLEADNKADDELLIRAAGIANLDFKLADLVYAQLVRGKAVPENIRGIWTQRDDIALRGNDPKEIRRIEQKHGEAALSERWQWLENEQT
jgi:hypothetical protein